MSPVHTWTEAERKVVRAFKDWMARDDVSSVRACTLLGVSRPTLSAMLAFKYPGRVDRICEDMRRHLRRAQMRAVAPERPPYVKTSITEQVVEACGIAHTERGISLVLSPSGVGKTIGLKRYCDADPDAIYIAAGVGASPWAMLKLIAPFVGVANTQRQARVLRQLVAENLADTSKLLVIDEIDYSPENTLQALRMLHDEAGIGMVWSGTYAFLERLHKNPSPTQRQVLRRIQYVLRLEHCSADDLHQIIGHYDLSDKAADAVVAGAAGEASRAIAVIIHAKRMLNGKAKREPITPALIQQAYKALMPVKT